MAHQSTWKVIFAMTWAMPHMQKRFSETNNTGFASCPAGCFTTSSATEVARIAEFLTGDSPQVIAHGYVSPLLKGIGETEIVDELRVIISEEDRSSAYFTFSSQMRPSLHEFRIYGPKNGAILDQDHETLIKLRGDRHKSYIEKFAPPFNFARQHVAQCSSEFTIVSCEGLPGSLRNEIFDRGFLQVDFRRYASPNPLSRNSGDRQNHEPNFRAN